MIAALGVESAQSLEDTMTTFRVIINNHEDAEKQIVLDFAEKYKGLRNGNSFGFESYAEAEKFKSAVRSRDVECSAPHEEF